MQEFSRSLWIIETRGRALSLLLSLGLVLTTLLVSCKTTQGQSELAGGASCETASLLERTLALLSPTSLQPSLSACLQQHFGRDLLQEKNETKDVRATDTYDYQAVVAASSQLGEGIYTRNNVIDKKVYIGGVEIGGTYHKLMAAANEEVLFSTFVWETQSLVAAEILNGLKEMEKNHKKTCPGCPPVIVRMIANHGPTMMAHIAPFTGDYPPVDFAAAMREAVSKLNLDPKAINIQVITYEHKMFGTNHAKSMVVDGQVGMVTGANPQAFNDPAINWHDSAYIVAGDVARALRVDLINNIIRAQAGTERDGDEASATALAISYKKEFKPMLVSPKSLMQEPLVDPAGIPIVIGSRNAIGNPSTSNNNGQNRAFQAVFYGARKNIKIQSPNFNDDGAIRALGNAVRRGVKVNMLLSKLFNCVDENKVGQGGQNEIGINRFLGECDASAPKGPNHDIRWFTVMKNGARVVAYDNPKAQKSAERPNNSHVKFTVVDDELVIVGSANMDTQSWNQSREINLFVFHPAVAASWAAQVFEKDFAAGQQVSSSELLKGAISCDVPAGAL